jgi:hypothetical protein
MHAIVHCLQRSLTVCGADGAAFPQQVSGPIKWETLLNAAEIGVMAKDFFVSLKVVVDSHVEKLGAEQAGKRSYWVEHLGWKI